MFSGMVERSVRVVSISEGTGFRRLNLANSWPDVKDGESIAINGVCLTVAELSTGSIGFDVIPETLAKTNLGLLQGGDSVHVERSLGVGDRISRHFVQGHVDGPGRLVEQRCVDDDIRLILSPPAELMKFVIPKGSV